MRADQEMDHGCYRLYHDIRCLLSSECGRLTEDNSPMVVRQVIREAGQGW